MKAIIEIARQGSAIRSARQQLTATRKGEAIDYRLSFESARTLFAEITPARLDLLDTLRTAGSCSIYALAKTANRNYSNVHADVVRLQELSLIERTEDDKVFVPFDAIEILMPLDKVA